jgi:hypothetical protein
MAYSNFSITQLEKKFGLDITLKAGLFEEVQPVVISPLLAELFKENIPLALAISTEKARSEFIVAPMLGELRKLLRHEVSLFSGVDFNVDPENGLVGVCDFIITRSTQQLAIESPIITLVEAKNDNIKGGLPQCIAEMFAAKIFNEREGTPIEPIYGVVTTGSAWQFLQLTGPVVSIDPHEYSIENPGKILGVLLYMAQSAKTLAT